MTTIPPVNTTPVNTPTSSTAATTAAAQQSLAGDQQSFLALLTAQLKNQDPTAPMDSNQFTQQLVAMTGVQQQITTNNLLQDLVNNQSGFSDPVSLIGKTATATTPDATLQSGQATWQYSLSGAAAGATLQVLDSKGALVWQTTTGALSAGPQTLNWNGQNLAGIQQPDGGSYTLQVVAKDASGASVASQIYQSGLVTSIQENNGSPLVGLNGGYVPLSSITTVTASS